jgi:glycogen synthase
VSRIAFLTPEYPTERWRGGLAFYVQRMALALSRAGHEVEVFVPGNQVGIIEDGGVRVERSPNHGPLPGAIGSILQRIARAVGMEDVLMTALKAAGLARAFARRDRASPFDIVECSDYMSPGLYIRKRRGRLDVVRCSWAVDLFQRVDGIDHVASERILARWERRVITRADAAYAPSKLVANHYRDGFGFDVRVLRTPSEIVTPPGELPPVQLPPRYLVFFGRINHRKGADTLAAALNLAWRDAPDLAMVWAGPEGRAGEMAQYQASWGERSGQVVYLGARPAGEVHAVVMRAEAAVLPSVVDNLPNTVIESLALGVPVVGTRGSSIDELVEDEVSGLLVPIGDADALARAMVRIWRCDTPWRRGEFPVPDAVRAMTAANAVEAWLAFAAQARMAAA